LFLKTDGSGKISETLILAKTMWNLPHPRLGPKGSFTNGNFAESTKDKEAREATRKLVKDLKALKAAGFTYINVCLIGEAIVSVRFHKQAVDGPYVFENGSLLLTSEGIDKHHNGIVSAEEGEWVIAEFQDGAINPEILKQYNYEDGWYVYVHQE